MDGSFLFSVFVFLAAACVMVPISKWTGLGSVIGYLAAGVLIGPFALGLITEPETILHFSEFGVVMMLFIIGLELQPKELWDMRGSLVGFGAVQVGVTALAIFAVALLMGRMWGEAAIIGLALALSSTAIAIQIMQERGIMGTSTGKSGFSVLLFQDIAVIPIIALVPVFAAYSGVEVGHVDSHDVGHGSESHSPTGWMYAASLIGCFAGMILAGRVLLRPFFHFVAKSGVREIFTATALMLVIGSALLMQWLGLSAALGAFIAGVVLADSHYRHQLERDIEPFKALLLGLFFISVGMSVNFSALAASPAGIGAMVIGLVAIKFIVLWVIAKRSSLDSIGSLLFAGLLAQGGEFAFVLFQYALAAGALSRDLASQLNAVVAISMAVTPLLLLFFDKVLIPRMTHGKDHDIEPMPEDTTSKIIILGFGRMGQIATRVLGTQGYNLTIIDNDPDHIEFIKQFGYKVYYGLADDMDLLHTAGAAQADLLIMAIDDMERANKSISAIRQLFPNLKIVARARNRQSLFDMRAAGVDKVVRETFRGGLALGRNALELLGNDETVTDDIIAEFTAHDLAMLEESIELRDDVTEMAKRGREARANIERTMTMHRARREAAMQRRVENLGEEAKIASDTKKAFEDAHKAQHKPANTDAPSPDAAT